MRRNSEKRQMQSWEWNKHQRLTRTSLKNSFSTWNMLWFWDKFFLDLTHLQDSTLVFSWHLMSWFLNRIILVCVFNNKILLAILFCSNDFNWTPVDSKYLHKKWQLIIFPYFSYSLWLFSSLPPISANLKKYITLQNLRVLIMTNIPWWNFVCVDWN